MLEYDNSLFFCVEKVGFKCSVKYGMPAVIFVTGLLLVNCIHFVLAIK